MTNNVAQQENAASIGSALHRAENALRGATGGLLRELGLTVTQHAVLAAVHRAPGGLSGAQLARLCQVTPQTMATVLATLETRELLGREPSGVHRRVLIARLTRTGRDMLRRADLAVGSAEDRIVDAFEAQEREELWCYLERIVAALS